MSICGFKIADIDPIIFSLLDNKTLGHLSCTSQHAFAVLSNEGIFKDRFIEIYEYIHPTPETLFPHFQKYFSGYCWKILSCIPPENLKKNHFSGAILSEETLKSLLTDQIFVAHAQQFASNIHHMIRLGEDIKNEELKDQYSDTLIGSIETILSILGKNAWKESLPMVYTINNELGFQTINYTKNYFAHLKSAVTYQVSQQYRGFQSALPTLKRELKVLKVKSKQYEENQENIDYKKSVMHQLKSTIQNAEKALEPPLLEYLKFLMQARPIKDVRAYDHIWAKARTAEFIEILDLMIAQTEKLKNGNSGLGMCHIG